MSGVLISGPARPSVFQVLAVAFSAIFAFILLAKISSAFRLQMWAVLALGALVCFLVYYFLKQRSRAGRRQRQRPFLPRGMRYKAQAIFEKGVGIFRRRTGRLPNRNEIVRIAITSSHILIKRRGARGHLIRQMIRKYLLERQGISYRMR